MTPPILALFLATSMLALPPSNSAPTTRPGLGLRRAKPRDFEDGDERALDTAEAKRARKAAKRLAARA